MKFTVGNRLLQQEDASQEDASIVLFIEAVNYKEKSTSKVLQVSRDLLYVPF